jgi:hypothetical protein
MVSNSSYGLGIARHRATGVNGDSTPHEILLGSSHLVVRSGHCFINSSAISAARIVLTNIVVDGKSRTDLKRFSQIVVS